MKVKYQPEKYNILLYQFSSSMKKIILRNKITKSLHLNSDHFFLNGIHFKGCNVCFTYRGELCDIGTSLYNSKVKIKMLYHENYLELCKLCFIVCSF